MKAPRLKALLPHLAAIAALLLIALIYCKPALDGKILAQSDNVQWRAMAKESLDYKQAHGITPLWTTSMFGGMPTYQLSMEMPYNYANVIPAILTLGLPKPANVFFLSALCFYILCVVLGARPWVGFLGAVAYTYASYSPILVATGHDTKMLAMAWLPAVVAGIILITRRQYLLGAGITALFLTYLIAANHLQITYYFFLLLGVMGIAYAVYCIRQKTFRHLFAGGGLVLAAVLFSIGANAVVLWTTWQYAKASNRGGQSELTPLPGQEQYKTANGLDKDYAFRWSYGKLETLTMLAPNIYGGSSGEDLGERSATYRQLISMGLSPEQAAQASRNWPSYWGDQPFTFGPVYLGVVICLLAVLGLFIIRSWHKWWILAITVLGICMSWGCNWQPFNYFLFDHLPFYNRFRAPSMSLILPQLTFAMLAVMTLNELVSGQLPRPVLLQKLKWAGLCIGSLLLLLLLISGSLTYNSPLNDPGKPGSEAQFLQMTQGDAATAAALVKAVREDREALYRNDIFRSLLLAALGFGLLWLFLKGRLQARFATAALAGLCLFDLLQVDHRYLNSGSYKDEISYSSLFQPSPADLQILQDKDPYYRVYNLTPPDGPFADAMTSYYHKSIGGYHAAKLQLYVDLIERQLSKGNRQVLNMLNTRYVIQRGADGQPMALRNPDALGNAWFVQYIQWAPNADEEMKALDTLLARDTAVIDRRYQPDVNGAPVYDPNASIRLVANNLNTISYESKAAQPQFAVFSEVYYKDGWKAFIDGQPAPYCRVNYALRGMLVPAGHHRIEFRFEPAAYYAGIKVSLFSYLAMLALLAGGITINLRKKRTAADQPAASPKRV